MHRKSMTRGRTPITKNIRVIDAAGNEYEATYPKRAKGLVKNGRARFIDEHTLCLACPPNDYLEDKSMNNEFLQNAVETEDRSNGPRPGAMPVSHSEAGLTMEWVVAKIEAIIQDNAHITDALNTIKTMPVEECAMYAYGGKAQATAEVVKAREETNRQTLTLLEKIYDDLRPQMPSPPRPEALLDHLDLVNLANMMDSESIVEIVRVLLGKA